MSEAYNYYKVERFIKRIDRYLTKATGIRTSLTEYYYDDDSSWEDTGFNRSFFNPSSLINILRAFREGIEYIDIKKVDDLKSQVGQHVYYCNFQMNLFISGKDNLYALCLTNKEKTSTFVVATFLYRENFSKHLRNDRRNITLAINSVLGNIEDIKPVKQKRL